MKNAPARSTYKLIENELDHYEVLLVERNATGQEIEKAYRHLGRLLEPQLKAGVKSADPSRKREAPIPAGFSRKDPRLPVATNR